MFSQTLSADVAGLRKTVVAAAATLVTALHSPVIPCPREEFTNCNTSLRSVFTSVHQSPCENSQGTSWGENIHGVYWFKVLKTGFRILQGEYGDNRKTSKEFSQLEEERPCLGLAVGMGGDENEPLWAS